MTTSQKPTYLTTREVAEYLRIKERKVYDLAASGALPVSRSMGKLLFPRDAIEAWAAGAGAARGRPPVVLGSHDPLLDWALRASGSDLAGLFDGSLDGLARFGRGEGIAAGLHVRAADGSWNVEMVIEALPRAPVVLAEWAWRQRGLVVGPGNPLGLSAISDLGGGRRVATRQSGAGSQHLLEDLVREAGLGPDSVRFVGPYPSETDAALAVLAGDADTALGLEAVARRLKLDFVPLIEERYDLLVDRKAWFDPPFQALIAFSRTPAFAEYASGLGGYRVDGLGTVHHNGP